MVYIRIPLTRQLFAHQSSLVIILLPLYRLQVISSGASVAGASVVTGASVAGASVVVASVVGAWVVTGDSVDGRSGSVGRGRWVVVSGADVVITGASVVGACVV